MTRYAYTNKREEIKDYNYRIRKDLTGCPTQPNAGLGLLDVDMV